MDFFATVGRGNGQQIFRVAVDQALQADLTQQFEEHARVLMDPNLVVVPFERENFTPDETEVLELNPFDLPQAIYDPLQNVLGCPVLPTDDDTIASISVIFGYDAFAQRLVFQVVQKAQRLTRRALALHLSGQTFSRLRSPGLILGQTCHAVFDANALRFKSLYWLKQIFDIANFYRAATEADVDQFVQLPSVAVNDIAKLKAVAGPWARTRIAFILDSGVLARNAPAQLATLAQTFGVTIRVVQNNGQDQLEIPDDSRELRSVLKFLEEEFYVGPITGVPYEANSKRRR